MSETSIVLVQLDSEAPPGLIAAVAERSGVVFSVVDAAAGRPSLDVDMAGGLIVLGSAAARIDPEGPLVAALRHRVAAGRPVLAVDAGAQALAMAAGGAVRTGQSHEFGYVDLSPTETTAADPVLHVLGTGLPVMEWHDDAIDLPDGVPVLARCGRGRVQAFRVGPWAYGLRFHPGATAATVRRWAELRGEAKNNPAIRVRIGAEIVRHQDRAERFGERLLEAWLALVRGEAVTPGA